MEAHSNDLPATFTRPDDRPWLAWESSVRWNLAHPKDTDQKPIQPLRRPLRAKERAQFMEALKNLMLGAPVDPQHTSKPLWETAMAALASTWPLIQPELHRLWNQQLLEPASDFDLRLAPFVEAGLGQPWGPQTSPDALLTQSWEDARGQAPWAYMVLERWWITGQSAGWNEPDRRVDPLMTERFNRWTAAVTAMDARLTSPVTTSHWRLAARQTLFSLCAGMAQNDALRMLAQSWKLGWTPDKRQPGGPDLAALDVPIHWAWDDKTPQWQALSENLIQRAMVAHLKRPKEVLEDAPVWMPFLREVQGMRKHQPAHHFPDAHLQQAIQHWNENLRKILSNSRLPSDFEAQLPWATREIHWQARMEAVANQWTARFRQMKAEILDDGPLPNPARKRMRA